MLMRAEEAFGQQAPRPVAHAVLYQAVAEQRRAASEDTRDPKQEEAAQKRRQRRVRVPLVLVAVLLVVIVPLAVLLMHMLIAVCLIALGPSMPVPVMVASTSRQVATSHVLHEACKQAGHGRALRLRGLGKKLPRRQPEPERGELQRLHKALLRRGQRRAGGWAGAEAGTRAHAGGVGVVGGGDSAPRTA